MLTKTRFWILPYLHRKSMGNWVDRNWVAFLYNQLTICWYFSMLINHEQLFSFLNQWTKSGQIWIPQNWWSWTPCLSEYSRLFCPSIPLSRSSRTDPLLPGPAPCTQPSIPCIRFSRRSSLKTYQTRGRLKGTENDTIYRQTQGYGFKCPDFGCYLK